MTIIYLLKMIACSAAFYALYALLFQREKMLVFNRFYLLGGLAVSFFIPFITITVPSSVPAGQPVTHFINEVMITEALPAQSSGFSGSGVIAYSVMGIFVLTSFYFLVRFVMNYSKLRAMARHRDSFCINDIRVVLLGNETVPHSFLKTVFLSKAEYEAGRVEAEVLEHELSHIRQKHSWDILWVELLQVFTWFNPMIYLYKRSIKINHELLADAAVVKYTDDVRSYQHVLLQRAVAQSPLALASSFNYYTTKKRLIMLTKKTNPIITGCKSLLVLPLLVLLVFVFSERLYAQVSEKETNKEAAYTADGVSSDLIKEYRSIQDKYRVNGKLQLKTFGTQLSESDRKRLEKIYLSMSEAQQMDEIVGFIRPPLPSEKNIVSGSDLNAWKNASQYGVWIDEKRVPNSVLTKYKTTDFSHFFVSRLSNAARNHGQYSYQVDLMTNAYYENYRKNALADQGKYILVFRKFKKPVLKSDKDSGKLGNGTVTEHKKDTKAKYFAPPKIKKDAEVQDIVRMSPKNEGVDKPLSLSF